MSTEQIDKLLTMIKELNGSDLHVSAGMPPKIRVHGHLRPVSKEPLTAEQTEALLLPMLDEKRQKQLAEKNDWPRLGLRNARGGSIPVQFFPSATWSGRSFSNDPGGNPSGFCTRCPYSH